MMEFESTERAHAWYDSEEYRPLKELRHRSADVKLIIVEGVRDREPPEGPAADGADRGRATRNRVGTRATGCR